MTKTSFLALAGLVAASLAGAAQAAEAMRTDQPSAMPAAADRAFAASNDAMMKGMEVRPSGDADRDFVAMMLPHHRGAVDMARVELRYGKDPALRKMARDIIGAQESEIGAMQAWQKQHPR